MEKERAKGRGGGKKITVGVVGPGSSCSVVERSLYDIDRDLDVKCYVREQVNACGEVMDECEQASDVVLSHQSLKFFLIIISLLLVSSLLYQMEIPIKLLVE